MFGKSFRLFKLLGFEVKIDMSWIIIAFLVTWSLAQGLFPSQFKGLSTGTYWIMGILGALGLFISIIVHEFSHSLVARRYGLPIRGITLFIFGGVAEMSEEPQSAKVEFLMAIAGPVASIIIGGVFYALRFATASSGVSEFVIGIFSYLGFINLLLAGFNLLPAFPLDGGRVLRSALWKWKNNIGLATRWAARIGSGFGLGMMVLGGFQFFFGNIIGGIWWFLIGMFLRNASRGSYQQLILRDALHGESVRHFMRENPVTVDPSISIEELVDDYVYRYHYKMFPVVEGNNLVGCVTTRELKQVPREEWKMHHVNELADSCSADNTIDVDTDALQALMIMNRTGNSRLMVTEGNRLVGVLSVKDMLKFLNLKVDLEGQQKNGFQDKG